MPVPLNTVLLQLSILQFGITILFSLLQDRPMFYHIVNEKRSLLIITEKIEWLIWFKTILLKTELTSIWWSICWLILRLALTQLMFASTLYLYNDEEFYLYNNLAWFSFGLPYLYQWQPLKSFNLSIPSIPIFAKILAEAKISQIFN